MEYNQPTTHSPSHSLIHCTGTNWTIQRKHGIWFFCQLAYAILQWKTLSRRRSSWRRRASSGSSSDSSGSSGSSGSTGNDVPAVVSLHETITARRTLGEEYTNIMAIQEDSSANNTFTTASATARIRGRPLSLEVGLVNDAG